MRYILMLAAVLIASAIAAQITSPEAITMSDVAEAISTNDKSVYVADRDKAKVLAITIQQHDMQIQDLIRRVAALETKN